MCVCISDFVISKLRSPLVHHQGKLGSLFFNLQILASKTLHLTFKIVGGNVAIHLLAQFQWCLQLRKETAVSNATKW